MLASKGSSGACFEVTLEISGLFSRGESDNGFKAPWPKFGRMGNTAFVMLLQAYSQVLGASGVMALRALLTDEDVNVGGLVHGMMVNPTRLPPAYARLRRGSLRSSLRSRILGMPSRSS